MDALLTTYMNVTALISQVPCQLFLTYIYPLAPNLFPLHLVGSHDFHMAGAIVGLTQHHLNAFQQWLPCGSRASCCGYYHFFCDAEQHAVNN
jgi:hypothetical protein